MKGDKGVHQIKNIELQKQRTKNKSNKFKTKGKKKEPASVTEKEYLQILND